MRYFHFVLIVISLLALGKVNAQVWDGYNSAVRPPIPNSVLFPNQPAEPQTGFFLLRTGLLMQGTATSEGKRYTMKTDFGSIQIPVENVEFVGKTPQDVYEYKNGSVNHHNCNELMKFGEWCFKNGLKEQGIIIFQKAEPLAPNDAVRSVIQNRLNAETVPPEAVKESDGSDLGTAAGLNVPKSVVDMFAKKVQPALVQRCAAADCHGSKSEQPFKISIPQQVQGTTTNRNLQATLPWLDLDYPTESKLLTAMISNHGGCKVPYSVESTQYNNTVQWIQLTAKELPVEQRAQLPRKERTVEKFSEPAVAAKTEFLPKGFQDISQSSIQQPKLPNNGIETEQSRPTANSQLLTVSSDPLDPAIFNDKEHPKVAKKVQPIR
ncbi:MAG: hypothetical protein LBN39_01455 [Planctomycetaceae bacterium]|jgi:hypothetical protein|nr:hypothetical protein [Planctomycetaceae bacterium]